MSENAINQHFLIDDKSVNAGKEELISTLSMTTLSKQSPQGGLAAVFAAKKEVEMSSMATI